MLWIIAIAIALSVVAVVSFVVLRRLVRASAIAAAPGATPPVVAVPGSVIAAGWMGEITLAVAVLSAIAAVVLLVVFAWPHVFGTAAPATPPPQQAAPKPADDLGTFSLDFNWDNEVTKIPSFSHLDANGVTFGEAARKVITIEENFDIALESGAKKLENYIRTINALKAKVRMAMMIRNVDKGNQDLLNKLNLMSQQIREAIKKFGLEPNELRRLMKLLDDEEAQSRAATQPAPRAGHTHTQPATPPVWSGRPVTTRQAAPAAPARGTQSTRTADDGGLRVVGTSVTVTPATNPAATNPASRPAARRPVNQGGQPSVVPPRPPRFGRSQSPTSAVSPATNPAPVHPSASAGLTDNEMRAQALRAELESRKAELKLLTDDSRTNPVFVERLEDMISGLKRDLSILTGTAIE